MLGEFADSRTHWRERTEDKDEGNEAKPQSRPTGAVVHDARQQEEHRRCDRANDAPGLQIHHLSGR
jgi:hypothetical protein